MTSRKTSKIEEPIAPVLETPVADILGSTETPTATIDIMSDILPSFSSDIASSSYKSERGGRIQELIQKLISELKTLDEEEARAESERQAKISDIAEREAALEHEYTTRKEAFKYEKASLEQ